MRISISATAVAVFFGFTSAFAGDLGDGNGSWKDGAEYPSLWEGMYVGATLGYGSGSSDHYFDKGDNHGLESNNPDGALIGATLGYNWNVGTNLIAGVEGDFSFADITGKEHWEIWDGHIWEPGWSGLITLRGRAGYEIGQNLLYATAGVALLDSDEYVIGDNPDQSADNTGWRGGWVIGLGVERQFGDRLSGKIEYLHADFGKNEDQAIGNFPYYFDNDLDVIRLGVNYKIN